MTGRRFIPRVPLRWALVLVALAALLIKAEDLRRRRLVFQGWLELVRENERFAEDAMKKDREALDWYGERLRQERQRPGSTEVSAARCEDALSYYEEDLEDARADYERVSRQRRALERSVSRPWEDPWPMRMQFWPRQ